MRQSRTVPTIARQLLGLAVLLAIPYLLVCALMYAQQRSLIYLPQYTQVAAEFTDFALVNDGVTLRGWQVNPGRERALLYFGGNAEALSGLREPLSRQLPDHTIYLLAYRGYGASDGQPSESALVADAVALFDHARGEQARRPVAVIGRSLGSGVAAHLASRRPIDRLVLVTPFDSLAQVAATHYPWLPVNRLLRDRYDSIRHLANHHGPILVVRAGRDSLVVPASTDRLIASLSRRRQVVELPLADHHFDLFGQPQAEALADFLRVDSAITQDPRPDR